MTDHLEPQPSSEAPGWSAARAAPIPGSSYWPLGSLSAWIFWLLIVMVATYAVTSAITPVTRGLGAYATPAFPHLWWAIWVASFVLPLVASIEIVISSFKAALSGDSPTVVAAALGALVVRRTTERQKVRWGRLAAAHPPAGGPTR